MIKYPEKEYPRTDILRWDIDLCAVLDAALETKGSLCEHGEGNCCSRIDFRGSATLATD
jgi:hypothetical protein